MHPVNKNRNECAWKSDVIVSDDNPLPICRFDATIPSNVATVVFANDQFDSIWNCLGRVVL
jgi:hypothetical protein